MEIRINLGLLVILVIAWFAVSAHQPAAALDPNTAESRELAFLEDELAKEPNNEVLARQLTARYLEMERPGLAIAVLRGSDPEMLEQPMIAYRLAQAYERTGRVLDAFATANLARNRCARTLGSSDVSSTSDVSEVGCSEREFAILDMHTTALGHMVRWGVAEPSRDPRSTTAYELATRRAMVASALQ